MIQTKKKVPPVAPDRTQKRSSYFKSTRPQNGFVGTILSRANGVRWLLVLACILCGYGFIAAANFLPAFACAGLGLLLAAGPEEFYRWLKHVRDAEDAALAGREQDGSYYGDGVPRDQGGHEFEPLDWGGVRKI